MRRWALVIVGSMLALYLLLGVALPSYVSSGDDNVAIEVAEDGSSVDLNRGDGDKKRPSLGGTKPCETKAPKVKEPKEVKTPKAVSKKKWSRRDNKKKRPSLIGPRPKTTVAPAKTAKPVAPATTTGPKKTPATTPVVQKTTTEKPVAPASDEKTIKELQAEIENLKVQIDGLTASVGDDKAKAQAIINLVTTQDVVRKAANKKQAELCFIQAKEFMASGRYKEAYEKAELAYQLDPDNNDYASLRRHLADIVDSSSVTSDISLLMLSEKVKIQQKLVEIRNNLDAAERLYAEAQVAKGKNALAMLDEARTKLGHAKFSLTAISAHYRPEGLDKNIEDLIKMVDTLHATKQYEADAQQQDDAQRIANDINRIEEIYIAKRIDDLIKRSYIAIHKNQYQLSELLLEKVTRLDPGNKEAEYLLRLVQKKGDEAKSKEIENRTKLETRRSWQNADEFMIPYHKVIIYPENWEEIDRNRSAFTEVKREEAPEWQKLIEAKMERKVAVSFDEDPLEEVIDTLRSLVQVTIIIDVDSLEGVDTPITLSLNNMRFKTALEWVLRIANLTYVLQDEAIWIASPDRIKGDKIMQIYDVRDLLGDVTYFPGPDMTLSPDDGIEVDMPDPPDPDEQLENIITMIQEKIEPSSWDDTTGSSITGREGKLIVTNTTAIHMKIEQMLDSFRKAQKLQVYINARFITITSDFLEDIGVTWSGLDRDNTGDVSGIANGAPAGFSSDPTKRTGGWDAYDLRGVVLNNSTANILGVSGIPYQSGEGLNLQYALLGNFQAEVILNAIQKSRKAITLLAPRLTVFNTQRAYMMVAREEAYIADYEGLIATQAAILDPVIKTFTVGMILDVRPIISSDRKYITIELRPTQASLIELKEYHINTNVWGTDYPIYAPVIELQKVRTTAVIPDNGVLLLGGQITIAHWKVSSGVPFISKLPIIGRLFSSDAESIEKQQLLIFINARILMFEELEEELRAR